MLFQPWVSWCHWPWAALARSSVYTAFIVILLTWPLLACCHLIHSTASQFLLFSFGALRVKCDLGFLSALVMIWTSFWNVFFVFPSDVVHHLWRWQIKTSSSFFEWLFSIYLFDNYWLPFFSAHAERICQMSVWRTVCLGRFSTFTWGVIISCWQCHIGCLPINLRSQPPRPHPTRQSTA